MSVEERLVRLESSVKVSNIIFHQRQYFDYHPNVNANQSLHVGTIKFEELLQIAR